MSEIHWVVQHSVLLRMALAVVLSGIIGWEREFHGRPAGFRTHVVVCFGATMLMLSSELPGGKGEGTIFDPDRMAAGIITGIGFLGAGAIMRHESLVRGLTTAACIWFVAALGIVIGKGFYAIAIWATVLVLIVLIFFRYLEMQVQAITFQEVFVRAALPDYDAAKTQCAALFAKNGLNIEGRKFVVDNGRQEVDTRYNVSMRKGTKLEGLMLDLSRLPGVKEVRL